MTIADSLLYLFLGMLAYKMLDLFTVVLKLEQALVKSRVRGFLPVDKRQLVVLRRQYPDGPFQNIRPAQCVVAWLHRERALVTLGPLIGAFAWFGVSAVMFSNSPSTNALIVGGATVFVSTVVSAISCVLERYRVVLEYA
jgi:hypothetical protein